MAEYDFVVIGGGSAGLVTSAGAAGLGARVALIERDRLGGECLWTGCVPSKALIRCAQVAREAREGGRFGIDVGEVRVDFARAMAWVRNAQRAIEPHDSPERFRSLGVEVIEGAARFTGDRTVRVNGRTLAGRHVVIATGSGPVIPPITGIDDVPYFTNETIWEVTELPRRLLVLGCGPVGLELAQAFTRLGSRVTVLEARPELLPQEDHELVELLANRLAADGLEILLGARVVSARSASPGHVTLRFQDAAGGEAELTGDALLVAAGRQARTEGLDLSRAGVELRDGLPVLDARLRTTAHGVWAAGDVTGAPRFTHVADYQARLILRNALFPFSTRANYERIPWVTYTDPELVHVGLTERQARDRHGEDVRVWTRSFGDLDRAVVDGRTDGMVKLIADRRGRMLGAHAVGHAAGSFAGEMALALKRGVTLSQLADTVHPYPTYGEALRQAAEGHNRARLTGFTERLVRWLSRHW